MMYDYLEFLYHLLRSFFYFFFLGNSINLINERTTPQRVKAIISYATADKPFQMNRPLQLYNHKDI